MQIHMTSDSEEMVPHFYIEVYKIYSFSDKTNWSQNSKILEGDTNEHCQKYIVHYELLQVSKYFQSAWHFQTQGIYSRHILDASCAQPADCLFILVFPTAQNPYLISTSISNVY
jgi:hypothetical protein